MFFDDLEEFERHVVYYLERPEEAAQIARAARAKQLLARMQRLRLILPTD